MKTSTTSKRWKRIRVPGFVTLFHDGGNGFKIRYKEPGTGKDVRRTIPADTREKALEIVSGYNAEIGVGRAVPGMKSKAEHGLSVRSALVEGIAAMGGNDRVKSDYGYSATCFIRWLAENHKAATAWADIRPSMIRQYLESAQRDGLAHDTVLNRLKPLRFVSDYWAAEFPGKYQDVVKAARIKLERPPAKPVAALDVPQLQAFLKHLRNIAPGLYPIAALQAFAGLRMFEAAFLRHCDVDFRAGTITITLTEHHAPKTRSSYRTIPVCKEALRAVQEYLGGSNVQSIDPTAEIFHHSKGGVWSQRGLVGAWRDIMKPARAEVGLPADFSARKLRATFTTLACRAGADYRSLQRYIGHAPGDLLGEHYQQVSVDDLRVKVVDVFESFWQQNGNVKTQAVDSKELTS